MKLLILSLLVTSCAIHVPEAKRSGFKKKDAESYVNRLDECVTKFVGKYGITAKDSIDTCERIYRRK
jgi:hypothetical protein